MTDNDPIIRIPGDKSKQCVIYRVKSNQGVMLSHGELYTLYDILTSYFKNAFPLKGDRAAQFDSRTLHSVQSEFKRVIREGKRGLDIGTSLQGDLF